MGRANELLQSMFGVTIVRESVVDTGDVLVVPPSVLPPALRGFQVGMVNEDYDLAIDAYLVTNRAATEVGMLASDESGKDRLVYFSEGRTIFMPAIYSYRERNRPMFVADYTPFFGDSQYDYFENEQAAEALLDLLIGMSR